MAGAVNMDVTVQEENCETERAASPKQPPIQEREELHWTDSLGQSCPDTDKLQTGWTEVGTQESKLNVSEFLDQNFKFEAEVASSPKQPAVERMEERHCLGQNCQRVDDLLTGSVDVETQESKLETSEVLRQASKCEIEGEAGMKKPTIKGMEKLHFANINDDLLGQKFQNVENREIKEVKSSEYQHNGLQRLDIFEALNQNSNTEILTPEDRTHRKVVGELIEQKQVARDETVENTIALMEDNTNKFKEVGPSVGDVAQNFSTEQNETTSSVVENLEGSRTDKSMDVVLALGYFEMPRGHASVNTFSPQARVMGKDVNADPNLSKAEEGTPEQLSTRGKSSANSRRVQRSKLQEKPKSPDRKDTAVEDNANGERKKRGRKKKQMSNSSGDEFSRTRSHLRYLLHRIRYDQNLIDAYSAEGWKGQSLEKLKPEKELQRAKSHILKYKLRIRELFQHLDLSLAVGKLTSLFDAKGEIDSEDIFCSKCGSKDLTLDNDIILCDGACERGFHQFCLKPPLLKQDIPPGDEGWLCPGCDCKVDCIGYLNDFQGTTLSVIESWEKIFPEAAASASGKKLDDDLGSSSDDSEDDDYDPDKPDTVLNPSGDESSREKSEDESSSDDSDYFSASDDLAASLSKKQDLGLPSDDSEDDDFDPTAPVQDEEVNQHSSSSDFTSDSEDLGALLDDAGESGISPILGGVDGEESKEGKVTGQSLRSELSYLLKNNDTPVSGKRHVERLDYKKLNDETYGNSSSESSDEDFEDVPSQKRRKVNRGKAAVTPREKTSSAKNVMDANDDNPSGSAGSANVKKSANRRLGEAVTQRLLESFRKNQYPKQAEKENLAKELEITTQQVSKWFENTRWSFNHRPQMELKMAGTTSNQGTSLNQENVNIDDLSLKRKIMTDQPPDTQIQEKNMLVNTPSSGVRKRGRPRKNTQ